MNIHRNSSSSSSPSSLYTNLSQAFDTQSIQCKEAGSHFYSHLLHHISLRLHSSAPSLQPAPPITIQSDTNNNTSNTLLCDVLQPYTNLSYQQLVDSAVAIRFCNALHYIVLLQYHEATSCQHPSTGIHLNNHTPTLTTPTHRLVDVFPSYYTRHQFTLDTVNTPTYIDTTLYPVILQTLNNTHYYTVIQHYMIHEPQTNECQRSVVLMLGVLYAYQCCITSTHTYTPVHMEGDTHTDRNLSLIPIRLYEVGCSAGFNLLLDQYRYTYMQEDDHTLIGSYPSHHSETYTSVTLPSNSEYSQVHLQCSVRSMKPSVTKLTNLLNTSLPLHIIERKGCDRKIIPLHQPTHSTDPNQDSNNHNDSLRLLSYIWADQYPRFERCQLAIHQLLRYHTNQRVNHTSSPPPLQLYELTAAQFIHQHLTTLLPDTLTILYHSVVWQYMSEKEKSMILEDLQKLSVQANYETKRFFAYIRMESGSSSISTSSQFSTSSCSTNLRPTPTHTDTPTLNSHAGGSYRFFLKVTIWPSGEEMTLCECHPHGAWLKMY